MTSSGAPDVIRGPCPVKLMSDRASCYCYNILDGFTHRFISFRLCILFYCTLSNIFLPISMSPPFNFPLLCLSIAYAYNLSFLILQSHHFILSLLFSKYFSSPPYLTKGQVRNVVLLIIFL